MVNVCMYMKNLQIITKKNKISMTALFQGMVTRFNTKYNFFYFLFSKVILHFMLFRIIVFYKIQDSKEFGKLAICNYLHTFRRGYSFICVHATRNVIKLGFCYSVWLCYNKFNIGFYIYLIWMKYEYVWDGHFSANMIHRLV